MSVVRRALSNEPGPVFLGVTLSEKKIVKEKFFFPLFPLNRYNSASIGQISIGKICTCNPRRSLSNDPGPVFLGAIVSEKKIVKRKFFFPLSPLNSYNSVPIGHILIKKIWACRARRALSSDPGPVFLGAICSARKSLSYDPGPLFLDAILSKIFFPLFHLNRYNSAPVGQNLKKKYGRVRREEPFPMTPKIFFSIVPLNRYNSAPIGQILIRKMCACNPRRSLSNDPGTVFLGAIVLEKKIVKEIFFFPLFSLNCNNSAPVGQYLKKKYGRVRREEPFPMNPVGCYSFGEKNCQRKFFFPLFPLNRHNSASIAQMLIKKYGRVGREEPFPATPVRICTCHSFGEKNCYRKIFFPFSPLNSYNSVPIGHILIKKIWPCRARRALSNDPGPVFVDAILSEKKIVKEKFFFPLFPINRYNSAPIGHILIRKICACRPRRSLSNDPGTVLLGAIVSEKKIVKKKFFFPLFPLNHHNLASICPILIKKIWACWARGALFSDPDPAFVRAIVSEKKIVKEKFFFPLFPLNRYNSAPVVQILIKNIWACSPRKTLSKGPVGKVFFSLFPLNRYNSAPIGHILIRKICACRPRRSLSNDPGTVLLGAIVSEKKIVKKKFFFPLFPLNHFNSASIGQILIKKYGRAGREVPFPITPVLYFRRIKLIKKNFFSFVPFKPLLLGSCWSDLDKKKYGRVVREEPFPMSRCYSFGEKNCLRKFFFPLFPLNRYNSVPIGQILIKKIWACRARRALSSDPGSAFVGAIFSGKKIVTEKYFFPLFHLNRYNSVPIGQILLKKIWPCRARRAFSNEPRRVFLGDTLSEKKIVKEKFFFPLFPLNHYNSASIAQMLIKKYGRVGREELFPATPKKFSFPFFPLNRYNSAPVGQILIKKIWVCSPRRTLSNGLFRRKKLLKKVFFPLFPLNRYNSAPIGHILIRKIWACRPRRSLSNDPGTVLLDLDKRIWARRARRALSNDPGPVFLGATLSENKIVKEKFFFPLFPLNRYNSAPIGQISIGKICACNPRRLLSNDPGPVFLGAIVSEKKIVKRKFFFPLSPLNSYNSVPIGHLLIKKIWACTARRALSSDPGPVFLGAICSARKSLSYDPGPLFLDAILSKIFFPLFHLNRYNSAPVGQNLKKKYGRVRREEPFPMTPVRARRALSSDPGSAFVGAIVSEKKIVTEKYFFSLFPLNRYNSVPIDLDKRIWAHRARRVLSNDPGPVFVRATLSENKIVKEKFFFPLFPLNRYNSAPIEKWACGARRALSNDPGVVFLDAILSEKKIVKEKFFFHLFLSNRYNSAPIVQILIKGIWTCRTRRALSNDPGPVFLGATLSEKKIVKEKKILSKKFFFPLFPLNRYNSVPIGQILIKKIWACRARRALSSDPGSAFVGAIFSEKKIVTEKYFFPLFHLNRYNSVPVDQILLKKIWLCRARKAFSNEPGRVFLGATLSEKKIVKEKFFFPLFPLNRYNSAPIGQILIRKICACNPRRSLSNDPDPVFLGAIVSEKKIVKENLDKKIWACKTRRALSSDPGPDFYNTVPVGHIFIKKIWPCRARRSLSNESGGVFLGAIVSEKKIVKGKARRAPSSDPGSAFFSNDSGPAFLGAILSEDKIVKEKFFFPLFPLNRYYSAPVGHLLIKKIWACSPRRTLSNGPVGKVYFPLFPLNRYNSAPIGREQPFPVTPSGFPRKIFFRLFPLNHYNSASIGQILIKKIWACWKRSAFSSDPGSAFVGPIVSEKKIVTEKYFFPLFPLNQIWACRARRALSNDPCPVFLGATLSEKKIVKKKFFFPLIPLNRYHSAPIGQLLIRKIWPCRQRRSLSNDSGPAYLGATLSENKIVKEKFFFPLFPLNRYNSAPVGQILIKKIWACRKRSALSNDPGPV
ncbi:LOW QUALITY PROTEIN: hypothetical protein V1477_017783 [Vespula maculifrons]|uniref:Uncharacterized protein n=1 Tax=Vespula maculifrons TaxID=7453 RepID=A0ABD2B0H3_VESMC